MIHISKFIDSKFGSGEAGKFKAASAFGKSQNTIYNWCNSDDHFIFETDKSFQLIKVKSEIIKQVSTSK